MEKLDGININYYSLLNTNNKAKREPFFPPQPVKKFVHQTDSLEEILRKDQVKINSLGQSVTRSLILSF